MQSPHFTETTWRRLGQVSGLILAITFVLPQPPDWNLKSTTAGWFAQILDNTWGSSRWDRRIEAAFQSTQFCSDYILAALMALAFSRYRRSPDRFWFKVLLAGRLSDSGSLAMFWVLVGGITLSGRWIAMAGSGFVLSVTVLAACRRGDRLVHIMFVNAFFLAFWFANDWLLPHNYFNPARHLAAASSLILLFCVIGLTKFRTQQTWGRAVRDLVLLRVGRHVSGRCPKCDYDLAGLPEPRCPECGAVFMWQEVGSEGPIEPAARA